MEEPNHKILRMRGFNYREAPAIIASQLGKQQSTLRFLSIKLRSGVECSAIGLGSSSWFSRDDRQKGWTGMEKDCIVPPDPFFNHRLRSYARDSPSLRVSGVTKASRFLPFVRRVFFPNDARMGRRLSSITPSSMWNSLCTAIIKTTDIVTSPPTRSLGDHTRSHSSPFPGLQDRVLSKCSDAHIYLDQRTCSPFQRWQCTFVSSEQAQRCGSCTKL